MSLNGFALVMGNNYEGRDADWCLSNAESDASSFGIALQSLGYKIFSGKALLARSGAEMSRDLSDFLDARHTLKPDTTLFYFAGHAIESVRHQGIFLLGNEQGADRPGYEATALDLMRVINSLKNGDGLSLIISDACRHLDGEKASRSLASRRIREALRDAQNTLVYLTTKSGHAAFDGKGVGRFVEATEEQLQDGTKGVSVVEFLTETRTKVSGKTDRKQIGELIESERLTQCFMMPRYNPFPSEEDREVAEKDEDAKKKKLEAARQKLNAATEKVRTGNNGIQYIMTAIYSNGWELPQSTKFLAEDHKTRPPTNLAPGPIGDKILAVAEDCAKKIYDEVTQESPKSLNGANGIKCDDIPSNFSRLLLWRWRCEPGRTFIFFAGGVGPSEKAQDFQDFSRAELDPTKGDLSNALGEYAEAFAEYYR